MAGPTKPEKVSKLEAARRQLTTAITLWFHEGDTVSIYTLSHAAYEVIHNLTKPLGRPDLLFDSLIVREEYRKDFNETLRRPANFFKHAKRSGSEDPSIEFSPAASELFIFFSIHGLASVHIQPNREELTYSLWLHFHKPQWLSEQGREFLRSTISIEHINEIRRLPKREFFDAFMEVSRMRSN